MIELHHWTVSIYFNVYQIAVVDAGKVTQIYVAGNADPFGVDETAAEVLAMIDRVLAKDRVNND